MPTLLASPRARAAALDRGLAVQTEANRTPVSEVLTAAEPSNKQRKRAEFLELQRQARERVYPTLRAVFPLAFTLLPVPLAIGIHQQILDALAGASGDEIDPAELSRFLRYWCTRRSYLIAVWRGTGRRNLDGSVSGFPTIKQRNDAGRSVWGERYQEIQEAADVKEAEVAAA